ncbi:MAG TPA: hypothetical protein VG271_16210 [Beijerinckiaceae bacterium]|jgi:hypothetical protein|nr:hypothetical protein [Beijerinckiaceae bacterium]
MSRLAFSVDRTYAARPGSRSIRHANVVVNANMRPRLFSFRRRFVLAVLEYLAVFSISSAIAIWWLIVK